MATVDGSASATDAWAEKWTVSSRGPIALARVAASALAVGRTGAGTGAAAAGGGAGAGAELSGSTAAAFGLA